MVYIMKPTSLYEGAQKGQNLNSEQNCFMFSIFFKYSNKKIFKNQSIIENNHLKDLPLKLISERLPFSVSNSKYEQIIWLQTFAT